MDEHDARPRRILIVDDDERIAATLQRGLRKLPNCEVVAETEGRKALQLFARQPFDLVITDYKMPGMNGITLAGSIQKLYPGTVVIMVTGYGDNILREQLAGVAFQYILDKPVKLTQMRNTVSEALAWLEESTGAR